MQRAVLVLVHFKRLLNQANYRICHFVHFFFLGWEQFRFKFSAFQECCKLLSVVMAVPRLSRTCSSCLFEAMCLLGLTSPLCVLPLVHTAWDIVQCPSFRAWFISHRIMASSLIHAVINERTCLSPGWVIFRVCVCLRALCWRVCASNFRGLSPPRRAYQGTQSWFLHALSPERLRRGKFRQDPWGRHLGWALGFAE